MKTNATILVCPCGRRLKAAGLAPGVRGRCPDCGRLIRMPGSTATVEPAPPELEDEWNWTGTYALDRPEPPLTPASTEGKPDDPADLEPSEPAAPDAAEDEWSGFVVGYDLGPNEPAPAAPAGPAPDPGPELLPVRAGPAPRKSDVALSPPPDPWWPPPFFYPSRAAEGLAMVAALGGAFWVMATLVPEYCLAILADGQMLGTPSMGRLVAVISGLPALMLMPLVVIYGLQYFGRVLVASAEGESRPPRPADRNLEGLLVGLSPWLLWLVLGLVPGILPLAIDTAALGGADPRIAAVLGLVGLPYALMALSMGFLHDDPLAARPWAVLGTIASNSPSFLGLSLTVGALLAMGPAAFVATMMLRQGHFAVYVLTSLACWLLAAWTTIVAMHMLGSYIGSRKERLRWRRTRARWGVRWSL